jgi:hypothetical protein
MKKITMLFAVVLFSVAGFAQKKKVAVVAFYADRLVNLDDVGMGGAAVISDLAGDDTFNLQPLVQSYHDKFFNDYAKKFPFELLPEATVTGNADYQAYQPEYKGGYSASSYASYPGYKPVDHNWGKNNEKAMLKIFPEADGVMFVYIDFKMMKGFGIGGTATTKMRVTTNITLYNKKGEKVFSINEGENSKKTGVMVGGVPVMKPEKVLPMCESALNELMGDLEKRLQKIIDKSAKKL